MPKIAVSLTLTCRTPPSVGAGGSHGTLADKIVTRDARRQFIIPASQVKGKLRHACEQLLRGHVPLCHPPRPDRMCPFIEQDDAGNLLPTDDRGYPRCLLCQVFGSPAFPSPLRFHDLTVVQADLPDETLRPMVSLNRRRRTAEAQRLFLLETSPHLDGLQFKNAVAITGRVGDAAHVQLLLAGLRLLFAWGGGASRGLGWGDMMAEASLDDEAVAFEPGEVKRLCQP